MAQIKRFKITIFNIKNLKTENTFQFLLQKKNHFRTGSPWSTAPGVWRHTVPTLCLFLRIKIIFNTEILSHIPNALILDPIRNNLSQKLKKTLHIQVNHWKKKLFQLILLQFLDGKFFLFAIIWYSMILLMWLEGTLRRGMTETWASASSMMVWIVFMLLVRVGEASKTTPSEVLREIEFDDSIVLLGLGFGLRRIGEVMKSYLSKGRN